MAFSAKRKPTQVHVIGDIEANGLSYTTGHVSPLKPMAFNFRFNQFFAIFPAKVNSDYSVFQLRPKRIILTFLIKAAVIAVVLALIYGGLTEQDYKFEDLIERATNNESFSRTDYFSIISHFMFLTISANIIFFNNLHLCEGLTRLCTLMRLDYMQGLGEMELNKLSPPSAKKLMIYRYSVCVMCTVASLFLFSSVHSIIRNPYTTAYDYVIIFILVVAVYVENQNHMFSELLFLRFNTVLIQRADCLIEHLAKFHKMGERRCCVALADNLHAMFVAINQTFGKDLLVAVFILNISIIFGFYLLVTFAIFISCNLKVLFLITYSLYAFIPSLRLYVLSQASERIRRKMKTVLRLLHDVEAEMPEEAPVCFKQKVRRSRIRFEGFDGFSADGFFHLNRGLMTAVVGTLVTYLIVLLQFKQADMQFQETKLESLRQRNNLTF